jgi:hypothetical protein
MYIDNFPQISHTGFIVSVTYIKWNIRLIKFYNFCLKLCFLHFVELQDEETELRKFVDKKLDHFSVLEGKNVTYFWKFTCYICFFWIEEDYFRWTSSTRGKKNGYIRAYCRTLWLYICIRVGHKAGPCTATFNDLLCLTLWLIACLIIWRYQLRFKVQARLSRVFHVFSQSIQGISQFHQTITDYRGTR